MAFAMLKINISVSVAIIDATWMLHHYSALKCDFKFIFDFTVRNSVCLDDSTRNYYNFHTNIDMHVCLLLTLCVRE